MSLLWLLTGAASPSCTATFNDYHLLGLRRLLQENRLVVLVITAYCGTLAEMLSLLVLNLYRDPNLELEF